MLSLLRHLAMQKKKVIWLRRSIAPGEQVRLIPMKIGPDVSPALAASRADETRFKIGQPDVIRPWIGAGRGVMRAVIVAAID